MHRRLGFAMSKILATMEIAKQTGVKCKLSKPSLLMSELPCAFKFGGEL